MNRRLLGPPPSFSQRPGNSRTIQRFTPPATKQTDATVEITKFSQVFASGRLMNAKNRRLTRFPQSPGYRLIGCQHGLLHHPMGRPHDRSPNVSGPSPAVQDNFGLGEIKIDGLVGSTASSHPLGDIVKPSNLGAHFLGKRRTRTGRLADKPRVAQALGGLGIAEPTAATDNCLVQACPLHLPAQADLQDG